MTAALTIKSQKPCYMEDQSRGFKTWLKVKIVYIIFWAKWGSQLEIFSLVFCSNIAIGDLDNLRLRMPYNKKNKIFSAYPYAEDLVWIRSWFQCAKNAWVIILSSGSRFLNTNLLPRTWRITYGLCELEFESQHPLFAFTLTCTGF